MEKENNLAATSFRIPADLKKRLKIAAANRDTDSTAVVIAGIRAWLGEGSDFVTKSDPRPLRASKEDQFWHDLLDEVLADKDEREGIEKNLRWATDSIKLKNAQRKKKPRSA